MAYSPEIIQRARRRLEEKKADKESVYRQHLQQAYAKVPRLREIDIQLRQSMAQAARAAFTEGADAVGAMEQVKKENLALQCEYGTLVQTNFAPGFLDDSPVCPHCGGNGYVGSTMCSCLAMLCLEEQRQQIANLTTGAERFSAFRLDYYSDRIHRDYGTSPRFIMEKTLNCCKQYAASFLPGCGNLLFIGGTGLGKTFLSACIANEVTEKGYSVAYESAPQLFAKLEKNRFNPDEESRLQADQFARCDLLIIDDLGTEMPGSFVTAALYSLVNDRLLSGKSMIISTNLLVEEIAVRYSPQIASRLQGEFKRFAFVGEDIRVLKNRGY
jgi:DNA replication protein DnaC